MHDPGTQALYRALYDVSGDGSVMRACALSRFIHLPSAHVRSFPGSSRKNHRQDQSALSVLAARFGYTEYISIRDPDYNKMLLHHQGKHAPREELGTCI